MYCTTIAITTLLAAPAVAAFAPSSSALKYHRTDTSSLHVAVDPEVVTKAEYKDICGVNFDNQSLEERLQRTSFLYPKHVEVIEDFAPMVDKMVDEIVSWHFFVMVLMLDAFPFSVGSDFFSYVSPNEIFEKIFSGYPKFILGFKFQN